MDVGAILEQLPAVFTLGFGGGGGFYAIRWIAEWVAGRLDKREAKIDAATDQLIKRMAAQIDTLGGETNDLRTRLGEVEADLRECHRKHAAAESEVMKLNVIIQGMGEIKQLAHAFVAAERTPPPSE